MDEKDADERSMTNSDWDFPDSDQTCGTDLWYTCGTHVEREWNGTEESFFFSPAVPGCLLFLGLTHRVLVKAVSTHRTKTCAPITGLSFSRLSRLQVEASP